LLFTASLFDIPYQVFRQEFCLGAQKITQALAEKVFSWNGPWSVHSVWLSALLHDYKVGSVAERVNAPFLRRPCDHDCVI